MNMLTRRHFLKAALGTTGAVMLAACGQPTAEVVKETVVVKETQIVEKQVTVAPAMYTEAPELARAVETGELPALLDRLPDNPIIEQLPEIGYYGGVITHFSWGETERAVNPWQPGSCSYVLPLEEDLAFASIHCDALEPAVAESWDIAADKKSVTFNLRKGIKWSDGEPFTVDDILFTWDDVITSGIFTSSWIPVCQEGVKVGGEYPTFEKVDDNTLKVTFNPSAADFDWDKFVLEPKSATELGSPNTSPSWIARAFGSGWIADIKVIAKHWWEKFHPTYNPEASVEDWNGAGKVNDRPPVMCAWAPYSAAGEKGVWKRNPYYWRVDQTGQQLPYVDTNIGKGTGGGIPEFALDLISGEVVWEPLSWLGPETPVLLESADKGDLVLYLSNRLRLDSGLFWNQDTPDESLRTVFRDKRFAQAINMIIDREQMCPKIGPVYAPWGDRFGFNALAAWPQLEAIRTKFDLDAGLAILDEMGIKDNDGDGWREFPPGTPKAGEPFGFVCHAQASNTDRVRGIEELKFQLEKLGIQVFLATEAISGDYGNIYEARVDGMRVLEVGSDPTAEGFTNGLLVPEKTSSRYIWFDIENRAVPSHQPVTCKDEELPWSEAWKQVIADYEAGTLSAMDAGEKVMELAQEYMPSAPLWVKKYFVVAQSGIGNFIMDRVPETKTEYWADWSRDGYHIHGWSRMWSWFWRK